MVSLPYGKEDSFNFKRVLHTCKTPDCSETSFPFPTQLCRMIKCQAMENSQALTLSLSSRLFLIHSLHKIVAESGLLKPQPQIFFPNCREITEWGMESYLQASQTMPQEHCWSPLRKE